jgi:phosphoribosylanthranilate isomerase
MLTMPWIKICGLRDASTIEHCLALQVDALGFVFAPSVRQVTVTEALRLAKPARGRAQIVAVLRTATADLPQIIKEFDPDYVQIDHDAIGSISPLRSEAPSQPRAWLPVFREGVVRLDALPAFMLYEGKDSGQGQLANWTEASVCAARTRVVLAGGLTPDNVGQAIDRVRPFGIDVSSGVERERGVKCPTLIKEFVMAARAVMRS